MATHRIHLPVSESVTDESVGNAMSTIYSWDHEQRKLFVSWKRGRPQERNVPRGVEFAQVKCGGGEPSVLLMQPPRDPVARVAWEFGFYGSKRLRTREEAEAATTDEATYFGYEHCPVILRGDGYLFVYSVHMEGQVWRPYKWWASKAADPMEIRVRFWSLNDRWPAAFAAWLKAVENAYEDAAVIYHGTWGHRFDYLPGFRWLLASIAQKAIEQDKPLPFGEYLAEMDRAAVAAFMRQQVERPDLGRFEWPDFGRPDFDDEFNVIETDTGILVRRGKVPFVEVKFDLQGVELGLERGTNRARLKVDILERRLRRALERVPAEDRNSVLGNLAAGRVEKWWVVGKADPILDRENPGRWGTPLRQAAERVRSA